MIESLIEDINNLFLTGADVSKEDEEALGRQLAHTICSRLRNYGKEDKRGLRLSSLGKKDREIWYTLNKPDVAEKLGPEVLFTFMYGDLLEDLVLFLTKAAGHTVEHQQETVHCGGIEGHIDCVIDGHLVDVKSASKFGFNKFADGSIVFDDPFGYYPQISSYHQSSELQGKINKDCAFFLAVGKERGKMVLCRVDKSDMIDAEEQAKRHKNVVVGPLPERCYEAVPDGKSGNLKLDTKCSYCPFKYECWKDSNSGEGLRTFFYSSGPRYLTHVEFEPKVPEKGKM